AGGPPIRLRARAVVAVAELPVAGRAEAVALLPVVARGRIAAPAAERNAQVAHDLTGRPRHAVDKRADLAERLCGVYRNDELGRARDGLGLFLALGPGECGDVGDARRAR